jgi:uncharacterized protein YlxP (DUF503 family)
MVIGLLQVSLSLPEARSLKDKRMVLRSLRDRIMKNMNVSVAEIGKQDYWKSAEMAFVTVSAQRDISQKRLSEVSNQLHAMPRIVVLDVHTEFF